MPASAESVPQRPQEPPRHQAPLQHVQQHAHQPVHQQPVHQQPTHQPSHQQPHQGYQQQYQQPHSAYQQPHVQDPPIYRALIRHWADRGRTLPGHHDPEWAMLVAPPVHRGQFSASRDPRGDVR
ncbi:hypothetical protein [Streptomyces atriruber]|uniref:hypothetical protein n=1 Tax=Streptomyces atriruber TaxID=545121 RepID=UPI0012FEC405